MKQKTEKIKKIKTKTYIKIKIKIKTFLRGMGVGKQQIKGVWS